MRSLIIGIILIASIRSWAENSKTYIEKTTAQPKDAFSKSLSWISKNFKTVKVKDEQALQIVAEGSFDSKNRKACEGLDMLIEVQFKPGKVKIAFENIVNSKNATGVMAQFAGSPIASVEKIGPLCLEPMKTEITKAISAKDW